MLFHKNRVTNLTQGGIRALPDVRDGLKPVQRREGKIGNEPDGTAGRGRKKRKVPAVAKGTASNEMCTFLILNISSLQLIPVNMIAYRSQYGSVNPAAIVGPAIVATAVSTAVAAVYCKVRCRMRRG